MRRSTRILASTRGPARACDFPLILLAEKTLIQAARHAGLDSRHELSLVLCDNATIRRINRRWRGMDKPTDVLSFPLHELRPGQTPPDGALGDIIVSLPYMRRAARELAIDPERHLAHLLIHGLLHLLGHDHATDAQDQRMRALENRLLEGKSLLEGKPS